MRTACMTVFVGIVTLASAGIAAAQTELPTLEEAQALSQRTGRPILAMAGRET